MIAECTKLERFLWPNNNSREWKYVHFFAFFSMYKHTDVHTHIIFFFSYLFILFVFSFDSIHFDRATKALRSHRHYFPMENGIYAYTQLRAHAVHNQNESLKSRIELIKSKYKIKCTNNMWSLSFGI